MLSCLVCDVNDPSLSPACSCSRVTQQPTWLPDQLSQYCSTCVQIILILLNNGPKAFHITFITVYCYHCSSVLLAIIVNLLLYIIYKFNLIIGINIQEKQHIQGSVLSAVSGIGGLGKYLLQIKEDYGIPKVFSQFPSQPPFIFHACKIIPRLFIIALICPHNVETDLFVHITFLL